MANLQTLDHDVLYEILRLCTDLSDLHCLVLTHPAVYRTFDSHRRLILRTVFRTHCEFVAAAHRCKPYGEDYPDLWRENRMGWHAVATTSAGFHYLHGRAIERANSHHTVSETTEAVIVADRVALHEAFRPELEYFVPELLSPKWAMKLLDCYRKAELLEDAFAFAKRTMDRIFDTCPVFDSAVRRFARVVVQTYMAAKCTQEAVELQEKVLLHLEPRSHARSLWAKELVNAYRVSGDPERALTLQIDSWELYRKILGEGPYKETLSAGHNITLQWARSIVCEYHRRGNAQQAIAFHKKVMGTLSPRSPQFHSLSRRSVRMHHRLNQDAEAVKVMEDAWSHLKPNASVAWVAKLYRSWAKLLGGIYEAKGRSEDAVAVCETAWEAFLYSLARHYVEEEDAKWSERARGTGLLLAKAYRRHHRLYDACIIEEKCSNLRFLRAESNGRAAE